MPPQIALPLFIAGLAALIGALSRLIATGVDQTAFAAGLIAVVLLAVSALLLLGTGRGAEAWLPTVRVKRGGATKGAPAATTAQPVRWPLVASVTAASIVAVVALSGVLEGPSAGDGGASQSAASGALGRSGNSGPALTAGAGRYPSSVRGKAVSVTGDSMRIGGATIRLAGIAAPEPAQTCSKPGSADWKCGMSALNALRRITGRRTITCTIESKDPSGRLVGVCSAGGEDIGAQLVKEGHAFADGGGLFGTRYDGEEAHARERKSGIWRGEAQHPQEYRNTRWDVARQQAPDGCPIKGKALTSSKVYVLPWAKDYERTDVRASRGDRWFCSEREAIAAGWQPRDS
jgi:endonuclease YncB( thermonuclease family)